MNEKMIKTEIIPIRGGYQNIITLGNQIFHIGFVGEFEEVHNIGLLFEVALNNHISEALAEKNAEIERLKLEIEYFKGLLVTADFQHTRGAK